MSPIDGDPPAEGPEEGEPASRAPLARLRAVWANPAYRFVILFLPLLGGVSVAYTQLVKHSSPVIQWFIKATAVLEYLLLDLFSSEVVIKGKMIWFGDFAVKIIDECTGIYEMLIFAAAVLAFPTSWRDKGLGILMGCPLIYLFNVIRIAMLIVVGRYWPNAFEFMHIYFWQATMIVMITTVWLLWITKVVKHDETSISHSA
ncbi:MAG: exosortase H [Myxococcota bacterium]